MNSIPMPIRRGLGLASAILGVLLGLTLPTSSGASTPQTNANLFAPDVGFAGYDLRGTVSEIGASWKVPRIADDSKLGDASTWIGTDNSDRDFIQLGTVEDKNHGRPDYFAFWSDTAKENLVQLVFPVAPGSSVSVRMQQTPSGWNLSMKSSSPRVSKVLRIPYGVGEHFARAQWLQEDPISSRPGLIYEPYPMLSHVRFSRLSLNGHTPALKSKDAQAMYTISGGFLVPSAYDQGSFTLAPPTGPGLQYLKDLVWLNYASDTLQTALMSGGTSITPSDNTDAVNLIDAFEVADDKMKGQAWPTTARPPISRMEHENAHLQQDLEAWLGAPSDSQSHFVSQFLADAQNGPVRSDAVRRALGLPAAY